MRTERLNKDGMNTMCYYQDTAYNPYAGMSNFKLPNCTAYACGRLQENAQNNFKNEIPQANAKNWYKYSKWEHSVKPVEGGVLCFNDNTYGHVGICERIIKDSGDSWTVLMSDSALDTNKSFNSAKYFRLRTITIKLGSKVQGCTYSYMGCLKNPYENDKRVERNTEYEQLQVYKNALRVRNSPSLKDGKNYGCFAPIGIYFILNKVVADGLTWCQIDLNQWCAVTNGYSKILPKEEKKSEEQQTIKNLKKENAILKNKLEAINNIIGS